MNRLTAGMLLAEPDAPESPLGRTTRGTVFGLVIAVVIAAGAVVFGLIKPGGHQLSGKSWWSTETPEPATSSSTTNSAPSATTPPLCSSAERA
ncbi:type VII secretion protein EccB [Streptomyces zhihengii]